LLSYDSGEPTHFTTYCQNPHHFILHTFFQISEGKYQGTIKLLQPLDFERQRSYSLTIKATDRAKNLNKRLTATANVVIDVEDVQDQRPIFINAPYSATTQENTPEVCKNIILCGSYAFPYSCVPIYHTTNL